MPPAISWRGHKKNFGSNILAMTACFTFHHRRQGPLKYAKVIVSKGIKVGRGKEEKLVEF
jgi:hypothetical protein